MTGDAEALCEASVAEPASGARRHGACQAEEPPRPILEPVPAPAQEAPV
jgi:hypothetical protein